MYEKDIQSTKKYVAKTVWRLHADTSLGARVRSLFDGANNSEIARRLGVHNSTIHSIAVSGTISKQMLNKIATYAGCNPDWLRNG